MVIFGINILWAGLSAGCFVAEGILENAIQEVQIEEAVKEQAKVSEADTRRIVIDELNRILNKMED